VNYYAWRATEHGREVWEHFKLYTLKAIEAEREHYGAKAIIEAIRFNEYLDKGPDSFKVNNNHAPYLAREFMHMHPQYDGFFETREPTAEGIGKNGANV